MMADGGSAPEDDAGNPSQPTLEDDRVYLVPYRWLREAQESSAGGEDVEDTLAGSRGILYSTSPVLTSYIATVKILTNLFNSDLVFNLQREDDSQQEDEAGISGCVYALIRTDMWSKALRWHHDSRLTTKGVDNNVSVFDDSAIDVFDLMLKISVARETSVMTVKISKKDNTVEHYRRASKIFSLDSELVHIWDFSGQTTLIIMNERNKLHRDFQRQSNQEISLVLHVYALLESLGSQTEGRKDDLTVQQSKNVSSYGGSLVCNGSAGNMDCNSFVTNRYSLNGSSRAVGLLGLTGLENLGNTCFMNSAIQCLAHTPKLVDFFLGDYNKEINPHNPLGMDGELASAFGELLRKLWSSERKPVAPRLFKTVLARFAPQFSGFNQHDSQELLAFLLDGLHEDLNRVKCKPYIEAKDALDRPDEEVANEYWANHLARNDSIIVDVCQGQYRSTLVCPVCNKVSVTFDPFMYLSLPLPSTTMRTMTVMVFSTDGSAEPSPFTITVPKYGKCKYLIQSLSIACSLRDDESLLVAEVYANRIIRYLEDFSDSLTLIRDHDRLAAYRLPKHVEKLPLVVFTHQREEHYNLGGKVHWKAFGVPFVTRLSGNLNGSTIQDIFLKLLSPCLWSRGGSLGDQDNGESSSSDEVSEMDMSTPMTECEGKSNVADESTHTGSGFEFYITDDKGQIMHSKIEMDEQLLSTGLHKQLHVLVCWPDKTIALYDICMLSSLPEIQKFGFLPKWPQDSISLYACLEAFLKEEPLGPEDMWYCPSCKMHRQASKKLDLWRLPEVLVIHLKRFSYSRFLKNKLETFVDFPIHDFDLSTYIACKNERQSNQYELYAMSNHYGSMGGGHYTAYVHHAGENQWYDFDDRNVVSIPENNIKTSAAYVLFYKRVQTDFQHFVGLSE